MFNIGDLVVFGTDGVCRVDNIGSLDMENVPKDKLYYTLSPYWKNQGSKIFSPVESKRVVMRSVISKEEADSLIAEIKDIGCMEITDEKKREESYKQVLQSCDCRRIIAMIKEICSRRAQRTATGKKLPSVDERYLNMAENALFSELAVPLASDRESVKESLAESFLC